MNPIHKSLLIEIPLGAVGNKQIQFPAMPELRGKKIFGFCLSNNAYTYSNVFNYFAFGNNTQLSFVTLINNKSEKFIDSMPLALLQPISKINISGASVSNSLVSSNANGIVEFHPRIVTWDKCFFYITDGVLVANQKAELTVFYQD